MIMEAHPEDNRAASAFFRAFGTPHRPMRADAVRSARHPGMHRGEWIALSTWVPVTLVTAARSPVVPWTGGAAGWIVALPIAAVLLHLLPFLLRARTPGGQWRAWLAAALIWSWFHRDAGGATGFVAWSWFVILALESAGLLWLGFLRTMTWSGPCGIAWRSFLLTATHLAALWTALHHGWAQGLAAGAGIAAFCCLAVLRPRARWLGPVTTRMETDGVLITIDDGPDPHDTPLLLDLLDEHGVKAVFFMIGRKVQAHPELAREVLRRGHGIGNHTLTHPQASFWCAGPWRTRREILECQRILLETTGSSPRWFRAPVGHRNLFTHPVAQAAGLRVMAWRRRGYDAVESDAGRAVRRILTGVEPGDILLLHEATPISAQVLRGTLDGLRRSGLLRRRTAE